MQKLKQIVISAIYIYIICSIKGELFEFSDDISYRAVCMLWSIFNFVVLVEVQQILKQTGIGGRLYATGDKD